MSENEPQNPPPRGYHPMDSVKRLGITFGLLFTIWLVFTYAVPYFFQPRVAVPEIPAAEKPAAAPAPDLTARLEALEARVQQLEERPIPQMAEAPPSPPPPVHDPRLDNLSEQIALHQDVVTDLKKTMETNNRQLTALTLFGQMKEAALSGNPYRRELQEFTALVQGNEAFVPLLAKLTPLAETGLPSAMSLQTAFGAAAEKALSPNSGAWSEKVQTLVRIRKVGEVKGGDDEAVLARAETRLQRNDIAQAIKELDQLSPPAGDAMAAWKKQAASYADAKEALDALQVALFKPAAVAP